MLFSWINHSSFRRDEQIIAILYELGIASRRQLESITGYSESQIRWSFQRIRQFENDMTLKKPQGPVDEEEWANYEIKTKQLKAKRDAWLRFFKHIEFPGFPDKTAYALGSKGIKYAADMRWEDPPRRKEASPGHLRHYLGINEILVRVMERLRRERGLPVEIPRKGLTVEQRQQMIEGVVWLNTIEAMDQLERFSRMVGKEFDRKISIQPDGQLTIYGRTYWMEYDNNTEGARHLEQKFLKYISALEGLGQKYHFPVVWVTTDEHRKAYLERLWKILYNQHHINQEIPEMIFFVGGQETDFLFDGNTR